MNESNDTTRVRFSRDSQGVTHVAGDLKEENAVDFQSRVRALIVEPAGSVILNLCELDIEDGFALAACINSLRELRARACSLVLHGAPQVLGHNLYRTGMLEGPKAVHLIDMRLDEPSGI